MSKAHGATIWDRANMKHASRSSKILSRCSIRQPDRLSRPLGNTYAAPVGLRRAVPSVKRSLEVFIRKFPSCQTSSTAFLAIFHVSGNIRSSFRDSNRVLVRSVELILCMYVGNTFLNAFCVTFEGRDRLRFDYPRMESKWWSEIIATREGIIFPIDSRFRSFVPMRTGPAVICHRRLAVVGFASYEYNSNEVSSPGFPVSPASRLV